MMETDLTVLSRWRLVCRKYSDTVLFSTGAERRLKKLTEPLDMHQTVEKSEVSIQTWVCLVHYQTLPHILGQLFDLLP
jgi:hypothetical protein